MLPAVVTWVADCCRWSAIPLSWLAMKTRYNGLFLAVLLAPRGLHTFYIRHCAGQGHRVPIARGMFEQRFGGGYQPTARGGGPPQGDETAGAAVARREKEPVSVKSAVAHVEAAREDHFLQFAMQQAAVGRGKGAGITATFLRLVCGMRTW